MSKPRDKKPQDALDESVVMALADGLASVELDASRKQRMQQRILQDIQQAQTKRAPGLHTFRAQQGEWMTIGEKLEKKLLYTDLDRGIETYLLRALPGAQAPAHLHAQTETCIVLEGQIEYADFTLYAGDIHIAEVGSQHSCARTSTGALLYFHVG